MTSSSTHTPSYEYTVEEKSWLRRHYGGEFRFLRSNALNICKEEQREEGRALARVLIDMEKEDELEAMRNNVDRSRERQSSHPANHGTNTHQRADGRGYDDHSEPGYIGSLDNLGPNFYRRHEFSDDHRRSGNPGQVDINYRQAQHDSSRRNSGASNNQCDPPSHGHRQTHQSSTFDDYDDDETSRNTGGDQNGYDDDDGGHGNNHYDDGDYYCDDGDYFYDDGDYDDDDGDEDCDYFYED